MNGTLNRAAQLIRSSKRTLFLTSAGMSADSNIPTFRDKEGYWKNFPPFKSKGLEAHDLASPWAFRNQLPHAWAFYEWRRRNAAENNPHKGYEIINRWISLHEKDSFVHTTNTDGYHIRSGLPTSKIKEVHGSIWRLQCLNRCTLEYWSNIQVPLCDLDLNTMKATNYPICKNCSAIARPHILMFGDYEYAGHPEQERLFSQFFEKKIDLVLLIGSSGTIPTNDNIAFFLKKKGTPIININPDSSADQIVNSDIFLKMKSKEALIKLDEFVNSI